MSTTFDPALPVRTRDGRAAAIVATGPTGQGQDTIAAIITSGDGTTRVETYQSNGSYYRSGEDDLDLLNAPPQTFAYVNVGSTHDTLAGAEGSSGAEWAIVKLTFENDTVAAAEVVREGSTR